MQEEITLSQLSEWVARFLAERPEGAVVGLVGELGSGKTTLVREVVRQLCEQQGIPPPAVTSPSYVIHQSYSGPRPVEHFDLYRLEAASYAELLELGYFESLQRVRENAGFLFIEWPTKAPTDLLQTDCTITLSLRANSRVYQL